MIESLYKRSEELQKMYSLIYLDDYIDLSKKISLDFLNYLKSGIPKAYDSKFSTVLARSIVFLNETEKLEVIVKLVNVLKNNSSIDIQRSYSGICLITLNSIKSSLYFEKLPKLNLDPKEKYDYEYIKLAKLIDKSHINT